MSEDADVRNEVHITREKVDTASGYIIEKKTCALKSKDKDMEYLIVEAKKIIAEGEKTPSEIKKKSTIDER